MVHPEGEEISYGNLTDLDKRILEIVGSQSTEDEQSSSEDEEMVDGAGLPDICLNGIPGVPEGGFPGFEEDGFPENSSEADFFQEIPRDYASSEVLKTVKIQNEILERISSSLAAVSEISMKRLKIEERKLKMKEKAVELKEKKLKMKEKKLKMKEKVMMLKERKVVLAERQVLAPEREENSLERKCNVL